MINWLKNIFEKRQESEEIEWKTDSSILKFLTHNIDEDGSLNAATDFLPDEKASFEDGEIRFASGLIDAMFGTDDSGDLMHKIDELVILLKRIATYGDKESESKFYKKVIENKNIIGIIDPFLQIIGDEPLSIEPYLFNFAKDLAFRTNHRNSVKFGIAILGLCNNQSIIKELKILALHDEFTIYSTVALCNISKNLVLDLWEIAKKVNGWGKIQIVNRLAKMELIEELKDWLIREGYKNSIMYEELAYICAVNGKLHEKLEEETIDSGLFTSAGEIIEALITGGPAEDISSYDYASIVIENFIRHAKMHTNEIADFLVLTMIKDYLTELQNNEEERVKNGWSEDIISNCLIDINEIIKSVDWNQLTLVALKSENNLIYWKGKQAAEKLGIDIWEIVWEHLLRNPLDGAAWYDVTKNAKADKADELIDFALNKLPLNELSTGPKDSFGWGSDFSKHSSLEYAIKFLEDYSGKGEPLILAGLMSPITRIRNVAIQVVDKWKSGNWSKPIREQLEKLRVIEPNKTTKENLELLLSGNELNWTINLEYNSSTE